MISLREGAHWLVSKNKAGGRPFAGILSYHFDNKCFGSFFESFLKFIHLCFLHSEIYARQSIYVAIAIPVESPIIELLSCMIPSTARKKLSIMILCSIFFLSAYISSLE